MRRPALAALLALSVAQPEPVWASGAQVRSHTRPRAAGRRAPAQRPSPRLTPLEDARAALAALVRDRSRRRFHHQWDKVIAQLLRAARGEDRAAALHEAARARYALYRWSANEADREEALRLASRAGDLGAPEARALAAAIRREAGDDRPAPRHRASERRAPLPAAEEEESTDPALERVESALAGEAGAPTSAEAAAGPARVSEVRAWSSPDYTRVALYLSHWVPWQRLELPADGEHPRRLALDLKPALLAGRTLERKVGGLRLSRVRAAQNDPETVRVVLDLAGDDEVQFFRLDDPPRLVLDLAAPRTSPSGASAIAEAGAAPAGPEPEGPDTRVELPPRALAMLERPPEPPGGPRASEAAPEEAAPPPRAAEEEEGSRRIHRIVVDAGHGGHDPGAIGPSRVREKDVTLGIARRLARRLREAGFEVVLTRDSDRFLALEERTALANAARGDLFVSVHANANPHRMRTGVETYYLNVTDDRYAARLAARENGVDLSVAGDLARILTDLDAKASAGESVRLARLVQREVCGGVRTRIGEVRDLGVKTALFYVLLGARMPAVLVETGHISNRLEERRLASQPYQDEVAAGIARAVQAFARAEATVATR